MMAGLMPIDSLKAQLAAQQGYDWNAGGVDRLTELAEWLSKNGITDLSKLGMETKTLTQETPKYIGDGGWIDPNDPAFPSHQYDAPYLTYDGKQVGDYLHRSNDKGYEFGASFSGDGNVGWIPTKNPDGTVSIGPVWGSSSDSKQFRDFAKAAAAVGGLAYGASLFAPAGAAGGAAAGTGGALDAGLLGAAPTFGEPLAYTGTLAGEAVGGTAGLAGLPAMAGGTAMAGGAGGLLSGLPSAVTDILGSKVGATLIGGLLGNSLKPDAPTSGTGSRGAGLMTNPAPTKATFKMPTWDRTSMGLPGGLGNQSAGLFDQYMRSVFGKG